MAFPTHAIVRNHYLTYQSFVIQQIKATTTGAELQLNQNRISKAEKRLTTFGSHIFSLVKIQTHHRERARREARRFHCSKKEEASCLELIRLGSSNSRRKLNCSAVIRRTNKSSISKSHQRRNSIYV